MMMKNSETAVVFYVIVNLNASPGTRANVILYCPLWGNNYTNFYILCKRCCRRVHVYKVYIMFAAPRACFHY